MSKPTKKPAAKKPDFCFSASEALRIRSLRSKGMSIRGIAKNIRRSEKAISAFIKAEVTDAPAKKTPAPAKAPAKSAPKGKKPCVCGAGKFCECDEDAPAKPAKKSGKTSVVAHGVITVKVSKQALLKAAFDSFMKSISAILDI